MNSPVLAIFSAFAVFCEYALAQPVKYDQRQEGDLNVRTDVEDVVFVVVPPQDLVTAGMGLVAATAADFFRKNYGSIGPERWPVRTSPKLGFVPLEKSPYKIDLEKSGVKVKKITHAGDPNRYNFHEGKNPTKTAEDVKGASPTEVPEKSTVEAITEMIEEMQSTTESKTVKKVLKPEETKKVEKVVAEEKKPVEEKKEKKVSADSMKSEEVKMKTEEKISEHSSLKVMANDKDPDSIFRLEDCGPDAYRDDTGRYGKWKAHRSKGLTQIHKGTDLFFMSY